MAVQPSTAAWESGAKEALGKGEKFGADESRDSEDECNIGGGEEERETEGGREGEYVCDWGQRMA